MQLGRMTRQLHEHTLNTPRAERGAHRTTRAGSPRTWVTSDGEQDGSSLEEPPSQADLLNTSCSKNLRTCESCLLVVPVSSRSLCCCCYTGDQRRSPVTLQRCWTGSRLKISSDPEQSLWEWCWGEFHATRREEQMCIEVTLVQKYNLKSKL